MTLTGGKNMSWIKDVKEELKALDISKKSLRNFGLLVGGIFLLLGFWIYYSSQSVFGIIFFVVGALLFIFGLLLPNFLSGVYKIWMGLAFALGWVVSRILLIILFYLGITTIGFIAKIFGKKFLDIKFRDIKILTGSNGVIQRLIIQSLYNVLVFILSAKHPKVINKRQHKISSQDNCAFVFDVSFSNCPIQTFILIQNIERFKLQLAAFIFKKLNT